MRNETYALLWAFLREATGVFPDTYIHLGGDEVPFDCWQVRPTRSNAPLIAPDSGICTCRTCEAFHMHTDVFHRSAVLQGTAFLHEASAF